MKVVTVCGITQSGKTTVVTALIAELRRRGYSVGSVKDIHFDGFAMDTEETNTYKHRQAGSTTVTARGHNETDVMYGSCLPIDEVLRHYHQDYVVLEGVYEVDAPKILTAHETEELDERMTDRVFMVSGRIADRIDEYRGLPAFSPFGGIKRIADLVEKSVPEYVPSLRIKISVSGAERAVSPACAAELAALLRGLGAETAEIKLDKNWIKISKNGRSDDNDEDQ